MLMTKQIVIHLGGSIVCPDDKIEVDYLIKFRQFILQQIDNGWHFVIVIGGGGLARNYQKFASDISSNISNIDKDWLGIYATRMNAQLLKTIFQELANPIVIDRRLKVKNFGKHSIIIASGWEPGCSTDFVSAQIAVDFGIEEVAILSKPDYIYPEVINKDGILVPNGEPIKNISWDNYLKMIPQEWQPGMHVPIDPVAAKLAKQNSLKFIVVNGRKLDNFEKVLKRESFQGTIVE